MAPINRQPKSSTGASAAGSVCRAVRHLETLSETSGPRGRIGLVKAVSEGRIDLLSPGFVSQMSECLDCRACEASCPSGVAYGQLVETARAQIRRAQEANETPRDRAGRSLWLHALFGQLGYLRAAAALLRVAQLTGLSSLAGWLGFRDAVALAPRIAGRFFIPRGQRFEAPKPQGLAFLHAGCVMQVAFPHVHEATIRMLLRAGLRSSSPPNRGAAVRSPSTPATASSDARLRGGTSKPSNAAAPTSA